MRVLVGPLMGRHWWLGWLWEPRDCWVGLFWYRGHTSLDVYLCLVPCLPLHFHRDHLPPAWR